MSFHLILIFNFAEKLFGVACFLQGTVFTVSLYRSGCCTPYYADGEQRCKGKNTMTFLEKNQSSPLLSM